jgi:hypothetical protein
MIAAAEQPDVRSLTGWPGSSTCPTGGSVTVLAFSTPSRPRPGRLGRLIGGRARSA